MTLGERIRQLRKKMRWTQSSLSEVCALSVPYISDIERDVVDPSLKVVKRLAGAFDLHISTLLEVVDGMHDLHATGNLQIFLQEYPFAGEISTEWLALLLKIEYKGQRPRNSREWLEVYMFLQRLLAPEEL